MVVLIVVLREPFGTLAANAARGMCPRPGVVGVVLPATAAPAKLSRRLLPRPPAPLQLSRRSRAFHAAPAPRQALAQAGCRVSRDLSCVALAKKEAASVVSSFRLRLPPSPRLRRTGRLRRDTSLDLPPSLTGALHAPAHPLPGH